MTDPSHTRWPRLSPASPDAVVRAQFAILVRNMNRGVPATLLALAIFGMALSFSGPTAGFWPWAALSTAMVPAYFVGVLPLYRRWSSAGQLDRVAGLFIGFNALYGGILGAACLLFFDTHPTRLLVLTGLVLAKVTATAVASAAHLPLIHAFSAGLALPFALRSAAAGEPITGLLAATVLLVVGAALVYTHANHAVLIDSIRMRFENERLLAETRERLD